MSECCGNCRFFRQDDAQKMEGDGFCKRYPPSLITAIQPSGEFPSVLPDEDWCGEWKPSDDAVFVLYPLCENCGQHHEGPCDA